MRPHFLIYLLVLLISSAIGTVRFKKLTVPFKFLAVLVIYSFLSECATRVLIKMIHSSMPAYHIIAVVHFVLFSIIYDDLIKGPTLRKIILFLIIPFIVFSIANTFYNQSFLLSFPSNSVLLSEAVYIFYALLLFRQMLLYPVLIPLSKQSVFWFNLAMLIFSAVTLFNLGMINYFNKHHIDTSLLDSIIYIISLSFYGLFGYALFINNKFDGENGPYNG